MPRLSICLLATGNFQSFAQQAAETNINPLLAIPAEGRTFLSYTTPY
ncbi:hypothetical protein [Acinetobacter sp. WZC-1]